MNEILDWLLGAGFNFPEIVNKYEFFCTLSNQSGGSDQLKYLVKNALWVVWDYSLSSSFVEDTKKSTPPPAQDTVSTMKQKILLGRVPVWLLFITKILLRSS